MKLNVVKSNNKLIYHKVNCPSSQEINTVLALFSEGRYQDAASLSQTITVRFPTYAFGWTVLGAICDKMGRHENALAFMQKAVVLSPNNPDVYFNLGNKFQNLRRFEEAKSCYILALQIKPDFSEVLYNLCNALQELDQLDDLVACYRRVLEIRPDYSEAYNNLGNVLRKLGRLDAAAASFLLAIQIKPDFVEAHSNLGIAFKELGRLKEAEESYKQALQINANYAEVHFNLGITLKESGRLEEAEASYRHALQINPVYAEAHNNLAILLLTLGIMPAGWEENEWRWATPLMKRDRRNFVQPQWRGEAAEGKTLLIHSEQGFGDTLQFCRYATLAAARGLRVVMEVQTPLVRLLRSLSGVYLVVGRGETLPAFDLHCPMLSMPLVFGTTLATIPNSVSYLQADKTQAEAWRVRLAGLPNKRYRIGLVWAGNSCSHVPQAAVIDRLRSVSPELLEPLCSLSKFHFFSLQKDGAAAPKSFQITDFMDEIGDFADTAALIANLDLVISVDTAVAHLAAALGKPIWVLNRLDSCWRWFRERQDSPWYPSLRIFRQEKPGNWQTVIEKVIAELCILLESRSLTFKNPLRTTQFQQALALHQYGQFTQARDACEEILKAQPDHFDALHLLGVMALQTNDPQRAVDLIGRAIEISPNNAAFHSNHGLGLQELNQFEAALSSFDSAIALKADCAEIYSNRGLVLHKLKQSKAALASFDQAIALKADYAEAYSNRGNVLLTLNQSDAALASYDQAIAFRADYAEAYSNRGNALQELKQPEAAVESFDKAISLKTDYAEAYYNKGNALYELKRLDEALASFEKAIEIKADYAEAYSNRGNVLKKLKQLDAALASYSKVIALNNGDAEAYNNRGNVFNELKQLEAALANYDKAIELKADYAEAYSNRGCVLQELKKLDAALANHNKAIALKADNAKAYSNRGNVLNGLKQYDEALASYDKAIELNADYAEAYSNRGCLLQELKQLDAALVSYDKAIELKADFAEAYRNKSFALLLRGDFDKGWDLYEWRLKSEDVRKFTGTRTFSQPTWHGNELLIGKTILLHSEQGLGDTLQFCRYAKLVADLGARVILEVQRPLTSLLVNLEGVSQLVRKGDGLPDFDYQCPLLSLPLAFKTSIDTIPSPTRYISSDASKIAQWQARLGEKIKPRIGLVWSGSSNHKNDHNRSIPLSALIKQLPTNFQYFSLQKEVRDVDKPTLRSCQNLFEFANDLNDFSDTAALCELMDVVISVDTSAAHLAAALGKPTMILLPFTPDWRWLLDRTDSPWYSSAKLYRQRKIGDWDGVIERVGADLNQMLNSFEQFDRAVEYLPCTSVYSSG